MTQRKARPQSFTLFGNQLDALPEAYLRYLQNGLREAFDLKGTPLRFSVRNSKMRLPGKRNKCIPGRALTARSEEQVERPGLIYPPGSPFPRFALTRKLAGMTEWNYCRKLITVSLRS